MKKVKTIKVWLCTGLTVLALAGCAVKAKSIDAQTLEMIAESGYFTLASRNETGRYGPVVILPERHSSRLIQAEEAYLMDLLAENSGLARVALEGMFQGETFDGTTLLDTGEQERTQAILWLLESGEITAPEFMYLAKNFRVFGIEKPEEYGVEFPDSAGYALDTYLLSSVIIDKEREMPDILPRALDRLKTAGDAESYLRYFSELLDLNPWTKETYEIITSISSTEEISKRLRKLLNKVDPYRKRLGISGDMREVLLEYVKFLDTAIKRSDTMSRAVEAELRKENGIMAMVIGADHTEDVEKYFVSAKISYYVFEPYGMESGVYASDLTNEQYSRKLEQRSVLMDGEIFRILEQQRKPRHVLGKVWLNNSFSLAALMATVIRAASGPPRSPPYGLDSEALMVGNFRIFADSITEPDDNTIMFRITNGIEDLYVKMAKKPGAEERSSNLRTALRQMIDSLHQQKYRGVSEDAAIRAFNFDNYAVVMGTGYRAVLDHSMTDTR
ncbi:MAG: hypothetical protein LBD86_00365 [Spirochaetaceae bacterium]|jgi:hypothetical protein|nr:hypothetical protein [Spirochaetaceae bacterium]